MKTVKFIIIVMADQHSSSATGYSGCPWIQTPHLDHFAQQSTVFSNAYTPSPVCVPARFAALSGLYPSHSGCVDNTTPLPITVKTAAHYFHSAGFLTAFIGKMHPVDPQTHGFDYIVDFGHYYDYLGRKIETFTRGMQADDSGKGNPWIDLYQDPENSWALLPVKASIPTTLPEKDQFESFVVREALRFLRTYRDVQPIFLFVSFLRPHTPLIVPEQYLDRYPLDAIELPNLPADQEHLNPYLRSRLVDGLQTIQGRNHALHHLQRYGAAVSYVDDQFHSLLEGLEDLGIRESSLIVYTSDHGDMLFEHGMLGKFTFYDASAKIPLVVNIPGQVQGQVLNTVLDHTNLLPTLLDAAGIDLPSLDSASLWPELTGNTFPRESQAAFSELSLAQDTTIHMIRQQRWKYITYPDGFSQLFHLEEDPHEQTNLAGQSLAIERELQNELHKHLRKIRYSGLNLSGANPRV